MPCKGEHMVMVWCEGVQCMRHRNGQSDGHKDRRTTDVTTKKKSNGRFLLFSSFLRGLSGQKETSIASVR
jgi:hypothetical protein